LVAAVAAEFFEHLACLVEAQELILNFGEPLHQNVMLLARHLPIDVVVGLLADSPALDDVFLVVVKEEVGAAGDVAEFLCAVVDTDGRERLIQTCEDDFVSVTHANA